MGWRKQHFRVVSVFPSPQPSPTGEGATVPVDFEFLESQAAGLFNIKCFSNLGQNVLVAIVCRVLLNACLKLIFIFKMITSFSETQNSSVFLLPPLWGRVKRFQFRHNFP